MVQNERELSYTSTRKSGPSLATTAWIQFGSMTTRWSEHCQSSVQPEVRHKYDCASIPLRVYLV